jgi:uncharacterized membrane protein
VFASARFQSGIALLAGATGVVAAINGAWTIVIWMVLLVVSWAVFAWPAMRQQANNRAD